MISNNPLERESYEKHENVEHVGKFLYEYFKGTWPETAHVYAGCVSQATDVTPRDESSVEALESGTEVLWVIVYPATGIEVAVVIGVAALVASIAAILLIPEVPTIKTPKQRENELRGGSPNNSLGNRQNVSRIGQRIPYIFGTAKSIPDKLMPEYSIYVDHVQQEIGYYCIGEGHFDFPDSLLVRDGDSPVEQIQDAAAHIYGPGQAPTGTGPFSGPVLAIGDPIDDPVLNVYEITAVNGQVLEPFNSRTVYGAYKIRDIDGNYVNSAASNDYQNFFAPLNIEYVDAVTGIIRLPYSKNTLEALDRIDIGDKLFIYAPLFLSSTNPAPDLQTDLTDPFANAVTVTALAVDGAIFQRVMATVSIPAALSADWALIPAYVAGLAIPSSAVGTSFDNPFIEVTPLTHLWMGPFFVDFEHPPGSQNQHVICNFVAGAGFYADDGTNINKLETTIAVEVAPADTTGTIIGPWEGTAVSLVGSDVTDGQRAITIRYTPTFSGRYLIRARRVVDRIRRHELPFFVEQANYPNPSNTPLGERSFGGRIVDEIRWVNAYSVSTPPNISFGDVTTVHTKTVATQGAVRIKQRELNIICTRKIQTWDGATFGGPLVANADAENVLFTMMKDPLVGNRPDSQIDFLGIATAAEAVRDYFNDSNTGTLATLVAHTFDDASTSFEEMATSIANLAFCQLYRQGNVLKMKPEIATDDGVAAFNHRNILPGSQKISHVFGAPSEHDSVEVEYSDPFDSALTSVKVPTTGVFSATRTVNVVGLHTRKQALWHAYRAYQKMQHQRVSLEMKTTQEAGSLIVRDRILVASLGGQVNRQNGHVVAVSGLNLTLSQTIPTNPGFTYTIFLQHTDGTVESIPLSVIAGNIVTLSTAPTVTLVTNPSLGVPTIFNIVPDDEPAPFAYMVSEQSAENNMVFNVSAVNYSNMYYFGDALAAWHTNQINDLSPEDLPYTTDHGLPIVADPDRGNMFDFDGANELRVNALVGPPFFTDLTNIADGYTFAVWCRHNNTPSFGYSGLLSADDDVTLLFGFFDNNLASGHNGTLSNSFALVPGDLHMVGVTYNPVTGRQAIFVDGRVVDFATVAAPSLPSVPFTYGKQYDGLADNFMRWKRCFSDRAMMELYLKTRL